MIRSLYKFDWVLFSALVLLLFLSLAVLFPISYSGEKEIPDESHFLRQTIFAVIGLTVFFVFAFFDYRSLKNYSTVLYALGFLLLLLVLIFGKVVRGTTGWLGISGVHLQPVEPFKIVAAILLAKYFSLHSRSIGDYKHILVSLVPVAASIFLVIKQPDFGSAFVIFFLWISVLVMSGINKKHLFVLFLVILIFALLGWNFFLKGYQKERITTLFNPTSDPLGAGYNVIQSTVAVGSGGFLGKGLGHGSQSQLNFLPEKHTDFIFAVVAEELGFGGAAFVIVLLAVVISRLIKIALSSRDNFGKLLVGGTASVIFVHSFINIGMNIGVMPVTGIPLPFLSYGGSSLITLMAAAGMAESVCRINRN
ncbi:MAG: rod shape-determining protein RodA [Candidatus Moranbacteria bacterium RIFOXYB1_FULL_43_19]|nr:MAG: rod shape-determining protein RodA [Candidatus Moranbacteria bacterium RIFOXYB1_FULL_43_19]OGI33634.1 MAG: rod shape-determining protein RodA [Candidatus Moranbacteria bacterium RIFOXYC1_FULL_44_13]OGI37178.1 MAG: rod shape-determining protein RodA [Candidatus Moranbacteria bacterium RIFOXYD1_FULL_44_12]